jgi:hypothetical protein
LWQGEVGFRSFRHSFCAAGAVPTGCGLNYAIPVVVLLLRLWAETPIDREGRAGSENREGERVARIVERVFCVRMRRVCLSRR